MPYNTLNALPLFDSLAITRLIEDVGAEAAQRLTASLIEELTGGTAALEDYVHAGDIRMLETKTHALKSVAKSFGAVRLGDLCQQMEFAASKGLPIASLLQLYQSLKDCTEKTVSIIEKLID